MTSKTPLLSLTAAAACLASSALFATPISIDDSTVTSLARETGSFNSTDTDTSTLFGNRGVVVTQAGSSSATEISFSNQGTGVLLNFDFSHARAQPLNSAASTYGRVDFTANQDTTFNFGGLYSGDTADYTQSWVRLFNKTTGSNVFADLSISRNTTNPSFNLGDLGDADFNNFNVGSPFGNLFADNEYFVYFEFLVYSQKNSAEATGSGCMSLAFGSASPECGITASVPEPAHLALLGFGLMALRLRNLLRAEPELAS